MDKKLLALMSLFFLSVTLLMAAVIFRQPVSTYLRAKEDFDVSEKDTILIGWPLQIPINDPTGSKISVFVRSVTGKPISSKAVSLTSNIGTISPPSVDSDKVGQADFVFTCTNVDPAGDKNAIIHATANGVAIEQTVSVQCQ